jgi:hypothetical protein
MHIWLWIAIGGGSLALSSHSELVASTSLEHLQVVVASTRATTGLNSSTSCRDRTLWPFSSTSIWNQPIGSGAIFAPANLFRDSGSTASPDPGRCDIPRSRPELRSSCPGTTGGVTQAQCEARGCCFAQFPSPDPHGYPWCFSRLHTHGPANFHNDVDYFVVTSESDPVTDWVDQGWWGSAASHNLTNCSGVNFDCHCTRLPNTSVVAQLRVPFNWTTDQRHPGNGAASFLLSDRTTVLQMQPTYRCAPGTPLLSESNIFCHGGSTDPNHDKPPSGNRSGLPGCSTKELFPRCVSILGGGALGAHGGSGVSALGGVIRKHEIIAQPSFAAGQPVARIPHAMKIELFAHQYYFRGAGLPGGRSLNPSTAANGGRTQYVWPATSSDNYANFGGSPLGYNGSLVRHRCYIPFWLACLGVYSLFDTGVRCCHCRFYRPDSYLHSVIPCTGCASRHSTTLCEQCPYHHNSGSDR